MPPPWLAQYIGLRYDTLDCWSLVRRVYAEQFGIPLPAWSIEARGVPRETILAADIAWQEVAPTDARLGDIVAITKGVWVAHVGLVIQPPLMLHTLREHDSVLEPYTGICYRSRVGGLYRHPALISAGPAHLARAAGV